MTDQMKAISGMTTRQKATAGVIVLVVLIILWQIYGMFGGGSSTQPLPKATPVKTVKGKTNSPGSDIPGAPTPADIMQASKPLTANETALMKIQQETQEKYLAALSQLQMLRVARDIAITTKDISSAKLASVTAEKKIVDMLSPPVIPQPTGIIAKNTIQTASSLVDQDVKYSVVSISQIQSRWSAVLSYKGNLYNVRVGDVLAPDASKVISIGGDGVTIQKDDEKKKLPLITSI